MSFMSFPDPQARRDGTPPAEAPPAPSSLADLYTALFANAWAPWTWAGWVSPWMLWPTETGATASEGAGMAVAHDLTRIEGIGPQIARRLADAGITTFAVLAATPVTELEALLVAAGPRFKLARPQTWPEQAGLLAAGDESGFAALVAALRGGRRP